MKAFSANGKACICQVPSSVRRRKLPDNGCVICGCGGCNPEDMRKRRDSRERDSSIGIDENTGKNNKKGKSSKNDTDFESTHSYNKSHFDDIEEFEPNMSNFDNSFFGSMVKSNFSIYPPLLGFGVPQRTYNYIYGKPPHN